MAYTIPPPGKMDMDGNLREDWSLFKLSWTNYANATRIDTKPAKVQVGTFLSIVGKERLKIIKNMPMTEEERLGPFVRLQTLLRRHPRIPLRRPENSNPQVPNWHWGQTAALLRLTTAPLQPSHTKLKLYDNSIFQPLGAVTLWYEANSIKKKVHFQVVDNNSPSLLSGRASSALQFIAFNVECIRHLDEVKSLTKEGVLDNCKDVFSGLRRLPGEYKIQIDKNVKPVQNNPRRVPLPLKMELEELVEQEVIAWVTEPTPWISNIVVIRKPHKLRICIDPYHLNKAIQRNHYPTPTVEEIATKMSKARLFSVVDAKDGFLQVALDESSSYLTTCWTPFGRIRWLRMPFGISSAPEEWQRRIDHCFEGLDNTQVIADDTIIYGSGENDAEADKSHDTAFRALIERCREKGLKLNPKKLNFKQTSVSYMRHIFSAQGRRKLRQFRRCNAPQTSKAFR